jgi:pimeloyl-ACP methyl ester carboxylesterase
VLTDQIERSPESSLTSNGIDLCYETFGRAGDVPMVLVMGLGAQMIMWPDDFCRQLAAHGRYVVRFDNRDVGRSTYIDEPNPPSMTDVFGAFAAGKPLPPRYTLVDMARDTLGLFDALGFERADIVGASMGGAIAQEIAINFPERLRTATLIFAPSGDPASPPSTPEAMGVLLAPRPTEREAFIETFVATWRVLAGTSLPFDEAKTRADGALTFDRGTNPFGAVRQMRAIVASGNRLPALAAATTPTLVLHGSDDPLVPYGVGVALAKAIPGATLETIAGMGHNLPREAWPQILGAIARHAPARAEARDAG